ncbi:MAG: hypothetical protein ACR2LP_01720 [Candidatus Limnocylindrales bacterium]|nr:hypothetical protein [Chloroflexota bacterium]
MVRRIALLALPLASLALGACQVIGAPFSLGPSRLAAEACAGPAREYSGSVSGSFDTTVGAIRAVGSRSAVPAPWPDLPPGHAAVLCYIDGRMGKAPPAGQDGEGRESFDRAIVGVVDGDLQMIVAGYRDQLPVPTP